MGESTQQPLRYYANNIGGLLTLLHRDALARGVDRIVFSSSATVYGKPEVLPIREESATRATNPYGETKLIGETILRDMASRRALASADVGILRYFNPVGAHESGRIWARIRRGVPNNLDALRGPGGRRPARAAEPCSATTSTTRPTAP